MSILITIFIILLSIYLLRLYKEYRRRKVFFDAIPGPKPSFLIGNGHEVLTPVKLYNNYLEWHKQFGNVFKVSIGPITQYIISDPDIIEAITTSNDLLEKADFYRFVKSWIGLGLVTSSGERWRSHRKMITPTFHFKILEQFIDIFDSNTNTLIKKIDELPEFKKTSVDIYHYITLCTLDIIGESAMGVSLEAQEKSDSVYVKATKNIIKFFLRRTYSAPFYFDSIYRLSSMYKEEQANLKIAIDFTKSVIAKRRQELARKGQGKDEKECDVGMKKKKVFLDMLLEANVDGKSLNDAEIREETDTFMFAGHDTTSSLTGFTIYCLSKYPDIQKKVFEEMESIFNEDLSTPATYADLQGMKYLDKVIKEVQRLYPTVLFIGRSLREDLILGDYTFLKGTDLIIYIHGAHMNPKQFKDPEKFDPERFEDNSERHIFSFIPFSAGPRNCIGQKFAILEVKSIVSKIVRHYELVSAIPEHTPILSNEGVLKSANGIRVGLRRRS